MSGKFSNIVTLLLITAMSVLLALSNVHPRLGYAFWVVVLIFIGHLTLSVRRQRRLARLAARLAAKPGHFLIDTPCLLDCESLSENLDHVTRLLLQGLVNSGRQDCRVLRPGLDKLSRRLKRAAHHHPDDPGPPALRAWCLALLCRLNSRAELWEEISPAAEMRMFQQAGDLYAQAQALAPENGLISADWGRALEQRADSLDGRDRLVHLQMALDQYEKAADQDPALVEAWYGQGRVLNLLALESNVREAETMLTRALSCYEAARQEPAWEADFYLDFGSAVQNLAKLHSDSKGLNYCHYAARLFILAAEKDETNPGPLFKAGQALYQAGLLSDEPEEVYQKALGFLEQAAELDPKDPWGLLLSARCLLELAKPENPAGDPRALLERAAELCARAASLAPQQEEILSEWANILSLLAEKTPDRAEELWAETARKYEQAVECPEVPEDRAAVNLHNLAYALTCLAELKPPTPRRRKLLAKAARKYEKAAEINGDNLITLQNWGDALGYQAELEEDPAEAGRLYELAAQKYQRAAALHPHQAGPWRRWSSLLQERARAEKMPGRRREMWQSALEKLEKGVQAEPDDPETWIMWGRLLGELFWEGPEYEHPLLIAGAIEKYEKALSLTPDDDQTWSLLGRMRLEGADLPPEVGVGGGGLAIALAAADNFKTACALNPNLADHWAEWGRAYFKVAMLTENEASSLSALIEATERYETAVALEPDNSNHHTGLGHVLYQWGWRLEETDRKREKFQKAYDHCGEAGRLDPHDPTVWRNWAKVAEALAALEKDPHKSFHWQSEADEKHYHADTLEAPAARRH